MNNQVLEIVICKTKPDVSREFFLELMAESERLLKGYKGYLGRKLLLANETQQWIDLVSWSTMEHALEACEQAAVQPEMAPLLTMFTDIQMQHLTRLDLDAKRNSTPSSNDPFFEVVVYQLKEGIRGEDYRALLSQIGEIASELKGFESREVYYNADTKYWAEVLTYASQAAANQVGGTLMETAEIKRAFSMINDQSVTMLFANEVDVSNKP